MWCSTATAFLPCQNVQQNLTPTHKRSSTFEWPHLAIFCILLLEPMGTVYTGVKVKRLIFLRLRLDGWTLQGQNIFMGLSLFLRHMLVGLDFYRRLTFTHIHSFSKPKWVTNVMLWCTDILVLIHTAIEARPVVRAQEPLPPYQWTALSTIYSCTYSHPRNLKQISPKWGADLCSGLKILSLPPVVMGLMGRARNMSQHNLTLRLPWIFSKPPKYCQHKAHTPFYMVRATGS